MRGLKLSAAERRGIKVGGAEKITLKITTRQVGPWRWLMQRIGAFFSARRTSAPEKRFMVLIRPSTAMATQPPSWPPMIRLPASSRRTHKRTRELSSRQ